MSDAVQTACPHCQVLNRLPRARLGSHPRCGRCHQPLFPGAPVALTGASFAAHLGGDLPLLVDFWAPWCGYCQKMAPAFARAAAELEPRLRLATVNTEEWPELAARHGIRGLPTLVLFQEGREIARRSGALTTAQIVDWVRSQPGVG